MSVTTTARWLFPVSSGPLESGTITVADGIIESVDPKGKYEPDVDLGNVAIIPGLGNAHTHLDLSGARGLIPPTTPERCVEWLEQVIAYRRNRTADEVEADIRAGLAEAMRYGTTMIGDISAGGASYEILANAPILGTCCYEILGLSAARCDTAESAFVAWFRDGMTRGLIGKGVSPHAPYSTSRRLFRFAERLGTPTLSASHIAEFPAERELLEKGTGPFVGFLDRLGITERGDLLGSPEEALPLSNWSGESRMIVHGNDLNPSAAALFRGFHTLAFCPRTHAAFGHARHPIAEFLAAGVRVALGTDSLASNPDLDPLAEARFLYGHRPDLPADRILEMVTTNAAFALGVHSIAGSLTPNRRADLVVIPLPDAPGEPFHLLLGTGDHGERRTLFAGEWR